LGSKRALSDGVSAVALHLAPRSSTVHQIEDKNIDICKQKLNWLAPHGSMVLLNTHSDYMKGEERCEKEEYGIRYYEEFLFYVKKPVRGPVLACSPKK